MAQALTPQDIKAHAQATRDLVMGLQDVFSERIHHVRETCVSAVSAAMSVCHSYIIGNTVT